MSDYSDGITLTSLNVQAYKSTALSELSPTDKPWDKHRASTDVVADNYAKGKSCHQRYSQRVTACSQLLDFRLSPDDDQGSYKLKLANAHFCRVRHCPVCQWRRSLMWQARAYKVLPKVVEDYPNYRWIFLTLTLKNCPINELRTTLSDLNKAFTRLTNLKIWPGQGWIKSVEVTRGRDGKSAHPHLHVLLIVKPSFYSHGYIKQDKWVELWQRCLRVDYIPQVNVRAVKPKQSLEKLVKEVLKYQTKVSDLIADKEWFLQYVDQVHKTRAVSVSGILRDYFRELEEEPEDLIGKDDEDDQTVDEGHLYFGWQRQDKKYKLKDV